MKKILSHLKWFFAIVPVGAFALITAPLFCLPARALSFLGYKNPFWAWLDDEILSPEMNEDWLNYKIENGFFAWYKWHAFRNTFWNFKNYIRPENARLNCVWNNEQIEEVIVDRLFRGGKKVSIYTKCIEMAGFKWFDKFGNEGWQIHSGEKMSFNFSTIGKSAYWYTANGKLYYRYSVADIRTLTFFKLKYPFFYRAKGFFEFKFGASEKRFLLTMKRKLKTI